MFPCPGAYRTPLRDTPGRQWCMNTIAIRVGTLIKSLCTGWANGDSPSCSMIWSSTPKLWWVHQNHNDVVIWWLRMYLYIWSKNARTKFISLFNILERIFRVISLQIVWHWPFNVPTLQNNIRNNIILICYGNKELLIFLLGIMWCTLCQPAMFNDIVKCICDMKWNCVILIWKWFEGFSEYLFICP